MIDCSKKMALVDKEEETVDKGMRKIQWNKEVKSKKVVRLRGLRVSMVTRW